MKIPQRIPPAPIALLLLAHACLLLPGLEELRALGATLALMGPGFSFAYRFISAHDGAERLFLGLSLGMASAILILFVQCFLPGLPQNYTLIVFDLISVGILLLAKAPANQPPRNLSLRDGLILVGILCIAAALRIPALDYSEFQGDEARAMILATSAYQDDPSVLFAHKKGPAEALLPLGIMRLTGTSTEAAARLPFALSGIILILGVLVLGRAMFPRFGTISGLIASVTLSLDGFLIAFSRIVQYQSILLLCVLAACLSLLRARTPGPGSRTWLLSSTFFVAMGLYCHYDTLFVLPALLYMSRSKNLPGARLAWERLCGASLLAVFLLSLFYIPFLLQERIGQTSAYLASRLGLQQLPTNNLGKYVHLLTFYSSAFFVYPLAVVLITQLAFTLLRRSKARGFNKFILVLGICGIAASIFAPEALSLGGKRSFAALLVLPALVAGVYYGHTSAHRFFGTWALCAFAIFSFFFARPNTHYYIIHPALALLAASFVVEGSLRWKPLLRSSGAIALSLSAILCCGYVAIAFVRTSPEFRVQFPRSRPALYRAPFGDRLPAGAYFGFPRNSGWRAVGALMSQGLLTGTYSSNEEPLITSWYTRGAERQDQNPQLFFISQNPNDPSPVSETLIKTEYNFWGRIYVSGQRRLDIYQRKDPTSTEPAAPRPFNLELLEPAFNTLSPSLVNLKNCIASLAQSR